MTSRLAGAWREKRARGLTRRAVDYVYVDWLVFGRELGPETPQPPPDPRLRFADLSDARPEVFAGSYLAVETARARTAAGHLCFAMLLDERPVATVWARSDAMWLPFLRRRVPLEPGQVYLYDSYTDRRHRRLGLTALRRAHSHTRLHELGFRSGRSYVMAHNRAGIAASRAAGYEVVERHRRVLLGPIGRGYDEELP